jgi:tRNA G10  N-methylase Trm11
VNLARIRDGLRRIGGDAVRPVVRLQREDAFTRTALRTAIERHLGRLYSAADAAEELWVVQTAADSLRLGLRVKARSRRGARRHERVGALRPAVAAAMVSMAGEPGPLLDACCGSGTILDEATAVGCRAVGGDVDVDALTAARANTGVAIARLDARRLPFPADSFDAVVTNLPFGGQYHVQGTPIAWYRRVLAESLRVAPRGVFLMPGVRPFRQALGRMPVHAERACDLTVLGRRASIWVVTRR